MFINEVTVENFRLFGGEFTAKINVPDGKTAGSGLTIFVGENGCGKTSLLDAIALPLLKYKAESFSHQDFSDTNEDTLIKVLSKESFKVGKVISGKFTANGFRFKANMREKKNKYYLSSLVTSDRLYIPEGKDAPKENSSDLRVDVQNPFSGQDLKRMMCSS